MNVWIVDLWVVKRLECVYSFHLQGGVRLGCVYVILDESSLERGVGKQETSEKKLARGFLSLPGQFLLSPYKEK